MNCTCWAHTTHNSRPQLRICARSRTSHFAFAFVVPQRSSKLATLLAIISVRMVMSRRQSLLPTCSPSHWSSAWDCRHMRVSNSCGHNSRLNLSIIVTTVNLNVKEQTAGVFQRPLSPRHHHKTHPANRACIWCKRSVSYKFLVFACFPKNPKHRLWKWNYNWDCHLHTSGKHHEHNSVKTSPGSSPIHDDDDDDDDDDDGDDDDDFCMFTDESQYEPCRQGASVKLTQCLRNRLGPQSLAQRRRRCPSEQKLAQLGKATVHMVPANLWALVFFRGRQRKALQPLKLLEDARIKAKVNQGIGSPISP